MDHRDARAVPRWLLVLDVAVPAAFVAFAVFVLVFTGCSPSQSFARAVQPIALHEVQHAEYGACHEVGARAVSRTLQRELIVYAGACLGRIDGGAAGDAAVSE